MGKFTFTKEERLSGEKNIQELFEKGSSFYVYPFKVIYLKKDDPTIRTHRVLISVSNKLYPLAVDRNRVKRMIREAYRLQKSAIENKSEKLAFALIYTAKTVVPFAVLKDKLFLVLEKIKNLDE
jgi:ribonuclease P protein component